MSVDVATTDDNGTGRISVQLGQSVVEAGVTYRYFRCQIGFYTVSWPLSRWLAAHVKEYDLVHIHALFSFPSTVAAFWANRRGVPYIVRPLGVLNTWGIRNRRPLLKRLSLRFIERRVLAGASAAHFTSDQEKCEAELALPGTRGIVIPNPVATPEAEMNPGPNVFLTRYPEVAGRRVILFLSRVDPKKGLDLLLDGFARVRAVLPDVVLVVAGNGDDAFVAQLQERARRLGAQQDIIWPGFLEGNMKRAALAAARVFVLPSYSENFGIAVVEAMADGLPVIVSDQVGIQQEIATADAGLVVSCNANEVSVAIQGILSDNAARDQMARNARRLAMEFSPPAVTARLLETYQLIARKNHPIAGYVTAHLNQA